MRQWKHHLRVGSVRVCVRMRERGGGLVGGGEEGADREREIESL